MAGVLWAEHAVRQRLADKNDASALCVASASLANEQMKINVLLRQMAFVRLLHVSSYLDAERQKGREWKARDSHILTKTKHVAGVIEPRTVRRAGHVELIEVKSSSYRYR